MIFRQLFDDDTWTYTYLLADEATREAIIIDPVKSRIDEYMSCLDENQLTLKYALETHVHADHITAGGLLRQRAGAQTAVSELCGAECADIQIQDGQIFQLGQTEKIEVIATPGHTPGSISFLWRDRVFTGDSLFIDGCGRSDFQGGDPGSLYDSITQRLFRLPDETQVYPGHDYKGRWISNIAQEKTSNSRLAGKTREQFIKIMNGLNLPAPKYINESVPANRVCGLSEEERQDAIPRPHSEIKPTRPTAAGGANCGTGSSVTAQTLVSDAKSKITEVDVAEVKLALSTSNPVILDVREPVEFQAGALPNAFNLPRGELEFKVGNILKFAEKNTPVIVYCRTGGRAAMATQTLQQLGYTNVKSMAGGYEAWSRNQG